MHLAANWHPEKQHLQNLETFHVFGALGFIVFMFLSLKVTWHVWTHYIRNVMVAALISCCLESGAVGLN